MIITAHDRKKYLLHAVRSVIDSNKGKNENVEIIVVKNFYDKETDTDLARLGVINIYTEDSSLSMKQYLGILKSSGDIIAFLEDDDMFSKNKISVLLDIFSDFKIDFFHNGLLRINEDLKETFGVNFDKSMLKVIHGKELGKRKIIKNLIHEFHPELYNSTITISRSLAMDCLDGLKSVDINSERFWFLCAIENKKSIALTNSPLTLYRIHSESYSQSQSKFFGNFTSNLLDRYISSYTFMLGYFKDPIVKDILNEMLVLHMGHKLLFNGNIADKIKILFRLLKISINPFSIYNEYSLLVAFSILVSIFSRKIASKIFYG